MPEFKRISPQQAQALLNGGRCHLADIRDEQSFQQAHIPGAQHVGNHNLQDFVARSDPDQALIVYCYHGNSSQSAAQYFTEQNFTAVYSLDGGFELWRQQFPAQTENG